MQKLLILCLLYMVFTAAVPTVAQETGIAVNSDWDHERFSWKADWITHPTASLLDYGVFLFRNAFYLERVPESLMVHLSADNRYKLWVNGEMVTCGPAKGSFNYWRYESIDLGPWLREGDNVLAVEVFNLGEHRPAALFSRQTAFIFQSDKELTGSAGLTGDGALMGDAELNTPGTWRVMENTAPSPIAVSGDDVGGYYVAGPTDRFNAAAYPWGWKAAAYDMGSWADPRRLGKGVGRGYMHGVNWYLVPRNIPLMESGLKRFDHVARSSGLEVPAGSLDGFISGKQALGIPPGDTVSILLDQGALTVGYPVLHFNGGSGSQLKITYAESLRNPDGSKGNRDAIEGKEILGYHDLVLPDGGSEREFQPLWLRTWRYVQLDVVTGEDSLFINDFYGDFSAYPFQANATFESNDPIYSHIWDVGWRTARLCAGETYMDCPYYEQLQYLGDTRIQALISLNVSGDDRLMRNALEQADHSRLPEGLTLSRGPSAISQVVPAFSLYWVDMVHDYYLYRQDDEFLRQFLPGIEAVLNWFERRIDYTGMLGPLEWFNFADWSDGFVVGAPPGSDLGHSALISLNYVYALEQAVELFTWFGDSDPTGRPFMRAREFSLRADRTRKAVYNLCYDFSRNMLADVPLDDPHKAVYKNGIYSQHTNIWAILCDVVPEEDQAPLMERVLADTTLISSTIYFRFYLFEAMKKAGMADGYTEMLEPWERMLSMGLTTFQEGDYKERSDCHAWSASPLYHFLSLVTGITPGSPGFQTVEITPALGSLNHIDATMPHPAGVIEVHLERHKKKGIKGSVTLPEGIEGTFTWDNYSHPLVPGVQEIKY